MSLGGYKFAGRFCQKGSLTDQQWALLMHKTKVAAFMAANTLSGAGWDYDMTGSPDGNYHCLDSVGNNYVTVFKRTNGENDYTWFAIYTLTYFTGNGASADAVKIRLISYYVGTTNYYAGYHACSFYRIGISAIHYDDNLTSFAYSTTGLVPAGNLGTSASNIGSSYYPTKDYTFISSSTVAFGFSVKEDNIFLFQGSGSSFYSSSSISCSLASGRAFSSFVNTDDTNGLLAYNIQYLANNSNSHENAGRYTGDLLSPFFFTFSKTNTQFFSLYNAVPMALYGSNVQEYPFQSLQVYSATDYGWTAFGKGTVKIDLLSTNMNPTSINPYTVVANGNYLSVLTGSYPLQKLNASSSYYTSAYYTLYVGWDPSNPDITQASAWTEYTDA